jgi:hypothetical protein
MDLHLVEKSRKQFDSALGYDTTIQAEDMLTLAFK